MYQNKIESGKNEGWLPLMIIGVMIGFIIGGSCNKYVYNPRDSVNGIDTIYTEDSVYVIHLNIDSVYKSEDEEYREQGRP